MPDQSSIPKPPRLTLQVGVTGHRPNRLPTDSDNLKAQVAATLQTIALAYREFALTANARAVYSTESPVLRLLSPLAEGADRIAADGGLAAGYELQCPLPFLHDVYAGYFADTPGSSDEFEDLLAKAKGKVLQLEGEPDKKSQAYRNVGHLVLNHADLLLAVWDGDEDETSPGTSGMVAEARRIGLPVVWVDAKQPGRVWFFDPRTPEQGWRDFNKTVIDDFLSYYLLPPDNAGSPRQVGLWTKVKQTFCPLPKDSCETYFSHPEPRLSVMGFAYRGFFALLGKTGRDKLGWIGNAYREDAGGQWQSIAKDDEPFHFPKPLQEHFIHADSLASHYADKYRGTFISCFVLGAFAVLCALLGGPFAGFSEAFRAANLWFAGAELILILLVVLLICRGKYRDYHRRWLDYRLLAERLRQAAFLMPIGVVPRWALPAYETHQDQSHAWIDWLTRTVIRADGIPNGIIDAGHKQKYRKFLCRIVTDQANYHHNNAKRNARIAHNLHRVNSLLLMLIIGACAAHIFHLIHDADTALTISATFLPALGATVAGILSQGEFERIAHRSKGMAGHLDQIKDRLDKPTLAAELLVEQANQAIAIMSQELSDWRIIFRAKPLEIHA
ncbi:MAG: DUF4231 domain-containing protein [Methylobacter sp.]